MSVAVLEASTGPIAILSGHVRMPLRGVRIAFLELDVDDGEDVPIGPVEIVIAGDDGQSVARLRGTVLDDDVVAEEGRARCIVRGGAGLLHAQHLAQRDYLKSPFDVSVGLIVRDAVEDAGEQLADDAEELLSTIRVPRWHRAGDCTAVEVLDRLAERFSFTWRLDDDGAVRVRLVEDYLELDADIVEQLVRTGLDDAYSRTIEIAPPAPVLRPGQTVLGRRIDEVVYRIDSSSLRVELYYGIGAGGTASDMAATVRAAIPSLVYREIHDATVRRQNLDGSLDLEADDPRVGALSSVPYCPGIVGCRLVFADGDRIRLAWQNGDETRPFAFAPEMLRKPDPFSIDPWGVGVARIGDQVDGGSLVLTAIPHPTGAIATIQVTYTPAIGPPTVAVLAPGTPVTIPSNGKITTGSSEVFIRGESR